jgi:hypothetical protein
LPESVSMADNVFANPASAEWGSIALDTVLPELESIAAAAAFANPESILVHSLEAPAAIEQAVPPEPLDVSTATLHNRTQRRLFNTSLFVLTRSVLKASDMPWDASSSAATAASAAVAAPLAILDAVADAAADPHPAIGMELAVIPAIARPPVSNLSLAIVPSTTSNGINFGAWKAMLDVSAKSTSEAAHEFLEAIDLYPKGFTFDCKAVDICAFDLNSPNGSLNSGTAVVQAHQLRTHRKTLRRIRQLLCAYTLRLHYWWITPFIYAHLPQTSKH